MNIFTRTATALALSLAAVTIAAAQADARPAQTAEQSHYICLRQGATPGTQWYTQCRDQQRSYESGGAVDSFRNSSGFGAFMEGFNSSF